MNLPDLIDSPEPPSPREHHRSQMPQPQQRMVVAVAGGTGGVGKTIVQQLQLHQDRFKVIVLTRNVSNKTSSIEPLWLELASLPHVISAYISSQLSH